jgi:hypothetical protein
MQNTLWESTGMILSSSCLIVMMLCTADVSVHTRTKSLPLMPMKKSITAVPGVRQNREQQQLMISCWPADEQDASLLVWKEL